MILAARSETAEQPEVLQRKPKKEPRITFLESQSAPWVRTAVPTCYIPTQKQSEEELRLDLKPFPKPHTDPSTQGGSLSGTRGLSTTSDQILAEQEAALVQGQLLGSQA